MKGQPKFAISIPKNEEEYDKKETAWHTVLRETVVTRHAEAPDRSVDAKPLTAAKLQKIEKTTKSFDEILRQLTKKVFRGTNCLIEFRFSWLDLNNIYII